MAAVIQSAAKLQEFPIHPLPLLVPDKMPQQLFAGQTVRLKGKSIDIGNEKRHFLMR